MSSEKEGPNGINREALDALGRVATRIVDDYDNRRPPFGSDTGLLTPIVTKIDEEREKALFLTLSTALNRQRDAEQLYSKCERLYYDEHWIFEPETLIESRDFQELVELFEGEGMRFGKGDAEVWYEIARTLYRDHDSDPVNLLEVHDYDMERVEEYVYSAKGETLFFKHGRKFPALRGDKIRPFWLRLMSGFVHPLGSQGSSDISVDTHIQNITNELLGTDYSLEERDKEEIRQFWSTVCASHPLNPVDIDGPLWFIDRKWDDWGRRYLREQLSEDGLAITDGGLARDSRQSDLDLDVDSGADGLSQEMTTVIEELEQQADTLEIEAQKLREQAETLRKLS